LSNLHCTTILQYSQDINQSIDGEIAYRFVCIHIMLVPGILHTTKLVIIPWTGLMVALLRCGRFDPSHFFSADK
jgi:hypothetical protein